MVKGNADSVCDTAAVFDLTGNQPVAQAIARLKRRSGSLDTNGLHFQSAIKRDRREQDRIIVHFNSAALHYDCQCRRHSPQKPARESCRTDEKLHGIRRQNPLTTLPTRSDMRLWTALLADCVSRGLCCTAGEESNMQGRIPIYNILTCHQSHWTYDSFFAWPHTVGLFAQHDEPDM